MNKAKDILTILVLFCLFVSITYFSYDTYMMKKKEDFLVNKVVDECFNNPLYSGYEPITTASMFMNHLGLPDSIKVKAIGKCAKKLYENSN